MPHLIIGHTTDKTARIWVRGDSYHRTCDVVLDPAGSGERHSTRLSRRSDYTGTIDITGLRPNAPYRVTARFSSPLPGITDEIDGRFHTFPEQPANAPFSFSFVLSSCNLSVVSIYNLLSFLAAMAGTSVALSSLDPRSGGWRWKWLRLLGFPLKIAVTVVAWLVNCATGLKQPPPPYLLRSPLLKLSAVFDASLLYVSARDAGIPAPGDTVWSSSARGVLACSATRIGERDDRDDEPHPWLLVLTQVEGGFGEGEAVFKQTPLSSSDERKAVGCVTAFAPAKEWHDRPAFFIHAGDQIYYDFPTETLEPDLKKYRLAYREAWFDDHANRHLLSHWPHYMTWDDHEIADQFARDFTSQANGVDPGTYLEKAGIAYREYVHSRHPARVEAAAAGTASHWYCFDKGTTRFFVLDTRSQRYNRNGQDGQVIDPDQLQALLEWMTRYKDDLKFVVTSVPFVAETDEKRSLETPRWNTRDATADEGNDPNDRWNAERFVGQRTRIIRHVFENRIERLVFLTGDMHCCYHATMRIGTEERFERRYECITVHELAGGPVNQLQLPRSTEFHPRRTGRIEGGAPSGKTTSANLVYEVTLSQFHGQVNAVMHVKVDHVKRDDITGKDPAFTPEVEWNVIRTLTDNGALAWTAGQNQGSTTRQRYATDARGDKVRIHEPVMTGRITFAPMRTSSELERW